MSEWICVKDRLPRQGEHIGYTFGEGAVRDDVHFYQTDKKWERMSGLGYYIEVDVTHWMPLPKAPTSCK